MTFTTKASTTTAPGTTSSWWWLFVVAGVIGLGAATIPWYRRRRMARSVSTAIDVTGSGDVADRLLHAIERGRERVGGELVGAEGLRDIGDRGPI